ncbi:hypothetical protein HY638_04905 [Candidatus Woesearchaeota archaeon]|nr:hypothetical protein [Candidatus Woesearchaeota archaeon]
MEPKELVECMDECSAALIQARKEKNFLAEAICLVVEKHYSDSFAKDWRAQLYYAYRGSNLEWKERTIHEFGSREVGRTFPWSYPITKE